MEPKTISRENVLCILPHQEEPGVKTLIYLADGGIVKSPLSPHTLQKRLEGHFTARATV